VHPFFCRKTIPFLVIVSGKRPSYPPAGGSKGNPCSMSFIAAVSSTSHFVAVNLSNTVQDLLFSLALPEYLVIEVKRDTNGK
jgi:hypothetical protein